MNFPEQTRNGCIALAQIGREHIRKLSESYGSRAADVVAREEPFVSIQAAIDLLDELTSVTLPSPPIATLHHPGRPGAYVREASHLDDHSLMQAARDAAAAHLGRSFRLDEIPSEPPTGVEGRRLAPDATPSPTEGTEDP